MEWQPIETAPKDGTWFLLLRAVTLIGAGRKPTAIPELMILRRARTTPESNGYWQSSYGNSVADDYARGNLWAPLSALPLTLLYENKLASGDTPFPLSEGDTWAGHTSERYRSIAEQRS